MIVKIKTLEELERDIKRDCHTWECSKAGTLHIEYKSFGWLIPKDSYDLFGSTIEAKEITTKNDFLANFTHTGCFRNDRYKLHEIWFAPNDFLSEEEFEI